MNVSFTNKDVVSGILKIEVEKSDYAEQVEKSLCKLRPKVAMRGFRQGKAPIGIVKKMYAKQVELEELDKIVAQKAEAYIIENDIHILGEVLPNLDGEPFNIDTDDPVTITFDIALEPKIDMQLTKNDTLTQYRIKITDELVNEEIEYMLNTFGNTEDIDMIEHDSDNISISGAIVELENGEPKTDGISSEYAYIALVHLKGEVERKKFIGAKKGDKIIINPYDAYNGNEAHISMMLNIDKDKAKDLKSNFALEVKNISRKNTAELNQALFDRVCGEGKAKNETEFRELIKTNLSRQYEPVCERLFRTNMRRLLLDKIADVALADSLLKRWLLLNKKVTAENVDDFYPKFKKDTLYQIIIKYLVAKFNIKIEKADIENAARNNLIHRYMSYGIIDQLTDNTVKLYVDEVMKNSKTIWPLLYGIQEERVAVQIKETITLDEQEITPDELKNIQTEIDNRA